METHVKRHQTSLELSSQQHLQQSILVFPKYEVPEQKALIQVSGILVG